MGSLQRLWSGNNTVRSQPVVQRTTDFRRIEDLPSRDWENELTSKEIAVVTDHLRCAGGSMALWTVQVAALKDMTLYRGAFLPIGVGRGKALISLLAPVVLEAERPLLIVPAQLRDQTLNYVLPAMAKHWRLHPHLRIIGYSELSLEKNANLLEEMRPDMIILDECHRVKNTSAGRTKRLRRWFDEYPDTICVAMSGTISSRSLRDFSHICRWCLGDGTPLPKRWWEMCLWADAIDAVPRSTRRISPGALLRFGGPADSARECFRRRFTRTPGVIATSDHDLGVSLRISPFAAYKLPPEQKALINHVRARWETPNGDIILQAVDMWRILRQLTLGFWYRWDPAPPKRWLAARREWKSYVRETLKHNRRQLDTELQVWNECARGNKQGRREWETWSAVRDEFKLSTQAEWVSDTALDAAQQWLRHPGICWVDHIAFGTRLSERSGVPYFGAGADAIISTPATSIIASIAAHSEGKNLQRWSRNLVMSPPTSGKRWEQLLARTHRPGQMEDEVTVEVVLQPVELLQSFRAAQRDAEYLEGAFGNRQKLNYADIITGRNAIRSTT